MSISGIKDPDGWRTEARRQLFIREVTASVDKVESLVNSGQDISLPYFDIFEKDLSELLEVQKERKLSEKSSDWTARIKLLNRLQAAKNKQLARVVAPSQTAPKIPSQPASQNAATAQVSAQTPPRVDASTQIAPFIPPEKPVQEPLASAPPSKQPEQEVGSPDPKLIASTHKKPALPLPVESLASEPPLAPQSPPLPVQIPLIQSSVLVQKPFPTPISSLHIESKQPAGSKTKELPRPPEMPLIPTLPQSVSIACAAGIPIEQKSHSPEKPSSEEPVPSSHSPLFTTAPEPFVSESDSSDVDPSSPPSHAELTAAKVNTVTSQELGREPEEVPGLTTVDIQPMDEESEKLLLPEGVIPKALHPALGITVAPVATASKEERRGPVPPVVILAPPIPIAEKRVNHQEGTGIHQPAPQSLSQSVSMQSQTLIDRGYCRLVAGIISRHVSRKTRITRSRALLGAIRNSGNPDFEKLDVKGFPKNAKGLQPYLFMFIWWMKNMRKLEPRKEAVALLAKIPLEQQFLAYTIVEKGTVLNPRFRDGKDTTQVREMIKDTLIDSFKKSTKERREAFLEVLKGEVEDSSWCSDCISLLSRS